MADRNYPEWQEQKALLDLVLMHELRYPVLTAIFHPPNEAKRSKAQHGMLLAIGMRPGVADLILPRARRGYLGLVVEMKAPGSLSATTPAQKAFLRQQAEEGWLACACDSAGEGWALLSWYASGQRHFLGPEPKPELRLAWF